jgi:tetratricopeptide (TPR) repeat protein
MDKGDFAVALADVDRFLSGNAQSAEGLDVKKQALYGLGKSQLEKRRYDESYRTLNQLAKLAPDYRDSGSLLREARERLIQHHYTQGLRLFREEKLDQAIAEWRIVLDYDPQHVNAKRNLDQAERLLKNLQQRQQPPPPPGQQPRRP